MSRLHNPGPGEILDRLIILALKSVHGGLRGTPTAHWQEELTELLRLEDPHNTRLPLLLELAAVNAALWQAEDDIRRLLQAEESMGLRGVEPASKIAFRIVRLNDRRAELVTLINCNAGVAAQSDKL